MRRLGHRSAQDCAWIKNAFACCLIFRVCLAGSITACVRSACARGPLRCSVSGSRVELLLEGLFPRRSVCAECLCVCATCFNGRNVFRRDSFLEGPSVPNVCVCVQHVSAAGTFCEFLSLPALDRICEGPGSQQHVCRCERRAPSAFLSLTLVRATLCKVHSFCVSLIRHSTCGLVRGALLLRTARSP